MDKKNLYILAVLLLSVSFLSGCAGGLRFAKIDKKKIEEIQVSVKAPEKSFRVGEKLTYSVSWNGIFVGTFASSVAEKTQVNGKEAYHLVCKGASSHFLDLIFKVNDTYHSYIDTSNFYTLKFERKISERFYAAHEITEYDQEKHTAVSLNLKNNDKNTYEIPANVQDIVSCLYYARTIDVKEGDEIKMDVNLRRKTYGLVIKILGYDYLTIGKLGSFSAFKAEPKASFRGIFIDRGKGNIWVTTDERRIPLVARIRVVPFGTITCTLTKIE